MPRPQIQSTFIEQTGKDLACGTDQTSFSLTANVDPASVLPRNLSYDSIDRLFGASIFCRVASNIDLFTIRHKCEIICCRQPLVDIKNKSTTQSENCLRIMHANGGSTTQPQVAQKNEMAASAGDPRVTLTLSITEIAGVQEESITPTSSDKGIGNCEIDDDSDTIVSEDYFHMTETSGSGSDIGVCSQLTPSEPDAPPGDTCDDNDGCESNHLKHIPATGHVKDAVDVKSLLGHQHLHLEIEDPSNDLELDENGADLNSPDAGFEENGGYSLFSMAAEGSGSTLFEDREFDFLKAEPVKRSTSLKTYKTPPGTPKRKAVRFADALGLDLESVRHILNLEDPPLVPKSAIKDLDLPKADSSEIPLLAVGTPYLAVCFQQPGGVSNFHERVRENKVLLENCIVRDMNIEGTVRVSNITYHKTVLVHYTTNNWVTSTDVACSYVKNSYNGVSDRFSYSISLPTYFSVGSKLQFALLYIADGVSYWDNNNSHNYIIECFARNAPSHTSDRTWIHFL